MTYRVASLLGDLEEGASSQLAWMRLLYDFLTVVSESRRITYGGDSFDSDDMESLSECSVYGDAAHFRIDDTGMVIFLMVPRAGTLSY